MDDALTPDGKKVSPADISIIICSRDRPILLEKAVDSVTSGTILPSEIVIVDQSNYPHPTLSTIEDLHGCRIQYKWGPERGVSRARNRAVQLARHNQLALIDDDVVVSSEWLGALIGALTVNGMQAVITGQVHAGASEKAGAFAPSTIDDQRAAVYTGPLRKDVLYTGNMAMFRESLRRLGGFDERLGPGTRFPGAEDNDFGLRLLSAGYKIVYVPEALVYHRSWRTDYFSMRWRYGRGQGAFYAKYISAYDCYGLGRFRSDTRKYLVRSYRRLRRERRGAVGDIIYLVGLLSGATGWLVRYHCADS